jgi:hypothetical protein
MKYLGMLIAVGWYETTRIRCRRSAVVVLSSTYLLISDDFTYLSVNITRQDSEHLDFLVCVRLGTYIVYNYTS